MPRPRRVVSRLATGLVCFTLGAAAAVGPDAAAAERDPRAVALAERCLEAMGGRSALEATRFLRFDFFGFRTHHWDRHTGRHRLEGQGRDGVRYVVLQNLDSREGRVWLDGEEVAGEEAAKRLEAAYGAWINDTYWLLMPYKLLDPGVNLEAAGEETVDGVVYDKVKLTFDGVGLTPGDTYWAYLNRETGLMDRWAYHLQGWEAARAPQHWQWLDWQRYGNIMLSSLRRDPESGDERTLGSIAVFEVLPDAVFTEP